MLFAKKVETIPFNSFMAGNWREEKKAQKKAQLDEQIAKMSLFGTVSCMAFGSSPAYASGMTDVIMKAFDPIVDLMQGMSYPVAFIMISGGFLLIMTGQKSKGLHFIKWACLGYLGLQFAPALMKIIVTIGQNIQTQVSAIQ